MRRCDEIYEIVTVYYPTSCINTTRTTTSTSTSTSTTSTSTSSTTTTTTTLPLPPFISVWRTTTPSESIILPYSTFGIYSGIIDWGDGNTSVNSFGNRVHTYTIAGDYTITITGTITEWRNGSSSKIIEILQWGSLQISNNGFVFASCTNLTLTNVVDTPNLSGVTSLRYMFDSCPLITTINNINNWDVSGITDIQSMFNVSPFNDDISSWDVSNVTNMDFLFANSINFNQDLSGWCVNNIPTEPSYFATGATSWVLPRPVWGTCPA